MRGPTPRDAGCRPAAGAVQKPGDRSTGTIIGIGPAQELAFEVGLQRCGVQLEHKLIDVPVMPVWCWHRGCPAGSAAGGVRRMLEGLGGRSGNSQAVERDDDRGPAYARASAE
jgi:hypothetical protein